MAVRFNTLGPLEVLVDDQDLTPTAPKTRQVLALLVSRHNTLVHTSELVDELWGERPPSSALATLQTYIYKLRKLLFAELADETQVGLRTRYFGYVITTPVESVDQYRFEQLSREGRSALDVGEAEVAAERLRDALALWRGPALGGLEVGNLLTAHLTRLDESRLRTLQSRIEADLRLGRHRELISELKELTVARSLDEGFHGQLMTALNRSGRQHEALDVYRRFRRNVIDQLGLEPSPALQRVHNDLLAGGGEEAGVPAARLVPARRAPEGTEIGTPAQLPHDIADFVGRSGLLEDARRWLAPDSGDAAAGASLRVLAVSGMPGIGKTSFAVRVAHRLRGRFDGGQLFCDLGGSGTPRTPVSALRGFLRAAGFAPDQLSGELDELATLFRTWSAERRLLVVLDDAAGIDQVRHLLPGGAGCAVLVTARVGVQSLPGARVRTLEPLSCAESLELLSGMIGAERVNRERAEAERLADLCGNLPLAVRCVGARLSAALGWPVSSMARHLGESGRPLDLLRFDGIDVRRSLVTGTRGLPVGVWRTFRDLSTLSSRFTAPDAARRLGCDPEQAEATLAQLVGRGLLRIAERTREEEVRFEFHPVNRWFAREQWEGSVEQRSVTTTHLPGCCDLRDSEAGDCPQGHGQVPGDLTPRWAPTEEPSLGSLPVVLAGR
ncbi:MULTISPECIES: AfsR/SARP family transcriptional regulator [Actinoalloteichus]|uniref:DNA-binding transcriptional activator of the SARP family n=1 Tax=Actinoalloteichus fjordicus TaxID=1612552 RepID=A0AAC9PRL8_9PSEU|nr:MULTISPECIES: AfsR/SARP family transcriptional regulator [Actinoalloteichus]APU14228.1 DNA-binding transcriptional activator of the SARP family [Actinoalloteichus fjordicus]APU20197.1 DNA-binding transcriptional activator of the SARP family [Actinoalloteichus sp. GBA129-24]